MWAKETEEETTALIARFNHAKEQVDNLVRQQRERAGVLGTPEHSDLAARNREVDEENRKRKENKVRGRKRR